MALLNRVFGPDLPKAIASKRPILSQIGKTALDVLGSMRSMAAGFGDMSFALRQGVFVAPRHPVIWTKAFGRMLRQYFDPKFFEASQREIAGRPSFELMRDHGLSLTRIGAAREEPFQATLPEKIPIVRIGMRAAERAYTGMGNRLRADLFDLLVKANDQAGADIFDLTSGANLINTMTGRGSLRYPLTPGIQSAPSLARAAPIMNAALFSPRLLASRLNLLDPMYYASLPKAVRMEALKSLAAFATAGSGIVGLAKASGVAVGTDYASADFGKIKFGNTRWDIWGGFQQPVVMMLRVLTQRMVSSVTGREFKFGEGYKAPTSIDIIQRFVGSKVSPPVRLALALLERKGFAGEPVNVPAEIAQAFIPMFAADVYELMAEHGTKRLWMAPLGFFGQGVQTYGRTIPNIERTPMGRPTVKFRPVPEAGEALIRYLTGTSGSNIPERYHRPLSDLNLREQRARADIDKAKALTKQDGKRRVVAGTLVYIEGEIVKTKALQKRQTAQQAVAQLQREGKLAR